MASSRNYFLTLTLILILISPALYASDSPVDAANNFYKMGRYKEAVEIYSKVKATYPDTDWAIMSKLMTARSLEKLEKNDDALEEYKNIISRHPKSAIAEEAFFAVARMRSAKAGAKNAAAAISAYNSYLKTYPAGQYKVMALFNIAALHRENKDDAGALAGYGEILKSYPNEPWFYSWAAIYTGHLYMKKKDYNRAVESYQRVLNTKENGFLYNLSLLHRGQAYIEKKEFKTAVAVFQQILKSNNYFAEEALFGLGKANYMAGDYEMAKESLTTLIQLFPETVWKKETESRLKTIEKRIKALREAEEKEGKEIK